MFDFLISLLIFPIWKEIFEALCILLDHLSHQNFAFLHSMFLIYFVRPVKKIFGCKKWFHKIGVKINDANEPFLKQQWHRWDILSTDNIMSLSSKSGDIFKSLSINELTSSPHKQNLGAIVIIPKNC